MNREFEKEINLSSKINQLEKMIENDNIKNQMSLKEFTVIVSAYLWLKNNEKNIVTKKDFESNIEYTNEMLQKIKSITDIEDNFEVIRQKINSYLIYTKSKELPRLNYDFSFSLCKTKLDLIKKIEHDITCLRVIENIYMEVTENIQEDRTK